jgi:hypothetical protein
MTKIFKRVLGTVALAVTATFVGTVPASADVIGDSL